MLKGNKGEWSEIYALFRLLADKKIYAADEDLNKIEKICFPIIKIIREEIQGEMMNFCTNNDRIIKIYLNGTFYKEVSSEEFDYQANYLLDNIRNRKQESAFKIEKTENFMKEINCYKIKAPSTDKSDITMQVIDINTGYCPIMGFSIKSELGSAPTLLNAGKTTNFIFKIENMSNLEVKEINNICKVIRGKKHTDVRGRIKNIIKKNSSIIYYDMEKPTFKDNLILIDSNMDKIIAETLLYFYRDNTSSCREIISKLEKENPMNYGNINAYRYKFKKFLTAVALGMKPATEWDGIDEASGGYIIVTKSGNVLAYHIYNRNCFEEYLLKNTKYETPSTKKHDFGNVYIDNDELFIKLNLQIRFI